MTIYYYSALKIHQNSNFKEMSKMSGYYPNYYRIWENKEDMAKDNINYTIVDKKICFSTFEEAQSKLVENIKKEIEKTQKKLKKLEKALVAHTLS